MLPPLSTGFFGFNQFCEVRRGFPALLIVQVSVHLHGEAHVGMPQAVSNDFGGHPAQGQEAGMGMAQIMQADDGEVGGFGELLEGAGQVGRIQVGADLSGEHKTVFLPLRAHLGAFLCLFPLMGSQDSHRIGS